MIFKIFFSSNKYRLFFCCLYFFSFIFFSFFTTKVFSEVVWQLPAEQRSSNGVDSTSQIIVTDESGANVAIIWRTPTLIQVVISNDFGVNWTSPPITLSPAGGAVTVPDITMSIDGQYIYGIWPRVVGLFQIELSRSIDFGVSWTPVGSVKVLSDNTTAAVLPSVATNDSGQYAYAIWQQVVGADTIIKASRSTDFGANWTDLGSVISLSEAGEDATFSQVTTNSSGQYAYAIWRRVDSGTSKLRVQTSRSIDFGASWTNPASVNTLSADDQNAANQKIITSSSGKYVYAVWEKIVDGSNTNIQFARSTDFGATFSGAINIVSSIGKATRPEIAIDDTGQYVYIVYQVDNQTINLSRSTDFGASFSSPITIVTGTSSIFPKIATNKTGKNVYVIWQDNTNFTQMARSSYDFGQTFSPSEMLTGSLDSFIESSITTDSSGRYVYAAFDQTDINVIIYSIRALNQLLLTTPIIRVFKE